MPAQSADQPHTDLALQRQRWDSFHCNAQAASLLQCLFTLPSHVASLMGTSFKSLYYAWFIQAATETQDSSKSGNESGSQNGHQKGKQNGKAKGKGGKGGKAKGSDPTGGASTVSSGVKLEDVRHKPFAISKAPPKFCCLRFHMLLAIS